MPTPPRPVAARPVAARPLAARPEPSREPKDVVALLLIMLRRWYIVVPAVVVSLLVGNFYVAERSTIYEAAGSQILEAPTDLNSGDIEIVSTHGALILGERFRSEDYRVRLRDAGLSDDLDVRVSQGSRILTIEIVGDDAERTFATANMVVATAQQELDASTGVATFKVVPIQMPAMPDLTSSEQRSSIVVSLAMVPPPSAESNPFPASFGTARVLVDASRIVMDELEIVKTNPGVSVQASTTISYGSAIVVVTASGPSAELATAAYAAAIVQLQEQLDLFQTAAGIPARDHTTLAELIAPGAPEGVVTSRLRLIAQTVLLCTGIAAGISVFVDRRALKRQMGSARVHRYADERNAVGSAART